MTAGTVSTRKRLWRLRMTVQKIISYKKVLLYCYTIRIVCLPAASFGFPYRLDLLLPRTALKNSMAARAAAATATNSASPSVGIGANTISVAVIGAGAAGLATTRVLTRNGIRDVTVLEKDQDWGGVWRYTSNDKGKPMYRGLRTVSEIRKLVGVVMYGLLNLWNLFPHANHSSRVCYC